jgi:hypothetical protein
MTTTVPARLPPDTRALIATQFRGLSDVPPELEWFADMALQAQSRHAQLGMSSVTPGRPIRNMFRGTYSMAIT